MGDVLPNSAILNHIQALVCDALQVVSYKWLSRKFSVSSNAAKRVLQEFVEQNDGEKIEVVYAVSGWTKTEPRNYSVQLVLKAKLQEARQVLDGTPSYHVYSVQPCLPKDSAQLCMADLVQAQELFNQPPEVANCLRDNRFSAVSCSLVTRSFGGKKSAHPSQIPPPSTSNPQRSVPPVPKALTVSKAVRTDSLEDSTVTCKIPPSSSAEVKEIGRGKSSNITAAAGNVSVEKGKAVARGDSRKIPPTLGNAEGRAEVKEVGAKKSSSISGAAAKGAGGHVAAGMGKMAASGGGSLASLWGRASNKPKPSDPKASDSKAAKLSLPNSNAADAEAGIRAMETNGSEASSDDDAADFAQIRRGHVKTSTGRKRQLIIDEEDEGRSGDGCGGLAAEEIVNLASPEPLADVSAEISLRRASENVTMPASRIPRTKESDNEQKGMDVNFSTSSVGDEELNRESPMNQAADTLEHASGQSVEKVSGVKREGEDGPGFVTNEKASSSLGGPKRKKVLKSRIDDHGREVMEVVWETDGVEEKEKQGLRLAAQPAAPPVVHAKHVADKPAASDTKVPNIQKGPSTKAPSKSAGKAAGKGPQKGNLFAFFKKV